MTSLNVILCSVALLGPLISAATVSLLPGTFRKPAMALSVVILFFSFLSAGWLLNSLRGADASIIPVAWFDAGGMNFSADLALSDRSLLMLTVVSLISFLVHLYSTVYMEADAHWKRYFGMLGFFTFSMQGIVLSDNLLLLFGFWELVGFSSYMLIGHYISKPAAGRAATKAFIMNRIGDAGFLAGLMIVWVVYGTFGISEIIGTAHDHAWQTAASLCIFCGVVGKSAQFPLFTWLPDAMEGPTPVSALIHAATMVAAGVYLLIRVFPVFTDQALLVVAVTGMVTTLAGALAALSQFDIKKILAYSTISQLGLMIIAIGMGVVDAALLHLITHAFFKGCLFLCAGLVIHALHHAQRPGHHFDVQDIRNMGGLRKKLPYTFLAFLISGASLAGIPFFSGFLSKEAILSALLVHTNVSSWLMLVTIISVSFLTVVYTFRMLWFVFMREERTIQSLRIAEPSWIMRAPVLVLAFCSLWFLVSWNPFDARGWMITAAPGPPAFSSGITVFSVLWVIAALALAWYVFRDNRLRTNRWMRHGFDLDTGLRRTVVPAIRQSATLAGHIDRQWIDRGLHTLAYGQVIMAHVTGWADRVLVDGTVNGMARLAGWIGKFTRSFQGGNIQLYIFWAVFTVIIFIIWALKQ